MGFCKLFKEIMIKLLLKKKSELFLETIKSLIVSSMLLKCWIDDSGDQSLTPG